MLAVIRDGKPTVWTSKVLQGSLVDDLTFSAEYQNSVGAFTFGGLQMHVKVADAACGNARLVMHPKGEDFYFVAVLCAEVDHAVLPALCKHGCYGQQ